MRIIGNLWVVLSLVLGPLKDQTMPYTYGFFFFGPRILDIPIVPGREYLLKSINEDSHVSVFSPQFPTRGPFITLP